MAISTERWLVEGAGARFLPGMDDPARDGDTFVFVDDSWPSAFQTRVGDSVFLRVSPTTGCYDFEDAKENTTKYVEEVMEALGSAADDRFQTE